MVSTKQNNRIEDREILFVTLILLLGEPPPTPFNIRASTARRSNEAKWAPSIQYAYDNETYCLLVKNMMNELGHNPNLGLFTEYMHWCKEQWHEQKTKTL